MVQESDPKQWHNRERTVKWFKSLTPEQRLNIALQIEKFRREAKFVED